MKKAILCVAALSFLLALGCGKREERVVAKIGDRTITIGMFEKAAETMEEKYLPAAADLEGKKALLEVMIDKEIMALKALAAGYDKEKGFVTFWERYKGQYLVAAMENELVIKKVKVTEPEIKGYFDKMHNEYSLSQIVLADENQARAVREQILAGAEFDEMARKYSLSHDGAAGGFIGPSNIGEMHHWVEEALFSMKEEDVSQPLATSTGYALIKVHRIRKIVPEKDIEWAGRRLRAIKEKQLIMELKKRIEKEVGLVIYSDAVDIVYNNLPPDINFADIIEGRVTYENAPKLEIPEQYHGMIMAQYADSSYSLKDYMKIYSTIALPDRPRRERGKEHIVESIHRRLWDHVLPTYVQEKLKIQNVPEVAKGLAEKKEMFLVYSLYNDQIGKEVVVSDPEVRQYFDEHKAEILTPERRDFGVILVGSKEKAEEVAALAKRGDNWAKLAMKHSEDPSVKENGGRIGIHPRGRYVDYDETVFSLRKGQVSDPVQVPRGWAIVAVFDIIAPEMVPFTEAAQSIKNRLSEERAETLLKEKLKKWREGVTITVNEGNLNKAVLNRTRPGGPSGAAQ